MKTLVMELRYHSDQGHYERYDGLVDGINDIVGQIAQRFDLDILSLSHVIQGQPEGAGHTSITCTAVGVLNGFTPEEIGHTLKAENGKENSNLYCFLDAHKKLSVRVSEIHYN